MVSHKKLLIGYKLFFSLLGLSALVTEIATLAERGRFNPVNFLSYFTVENNMLVCLVLLLSALYMAGRRSPRWLDKLRGATTIYIVVVGIGFALLLSGLENVALTAVPWDNTVLHYIIPISMVIDLLIDPPKTTLSFTQSLIWLLYPAVYLLYSLIRGAYTDWYPYPFLNPNHAGYTSIALVAAGLFGLATVLIWLVCIWSGSRKRAPKASTL